MGKAGAAGDLSSSSGATDAGFALRRYLEESICADTQDGRSSKDEASFHPFYRSGHPSQEGLYTLSELGDGCVD